MKESTPSRLIDSKTVQKSKEFPAMRKAFCQGLLSIKPQWDQVRGHWCNSLEAAGVDKGNIDQCEFPTADEFISLFPKTVPALRRRIVAGTHVLNCWGMNYYQAVAVLNAMLELYARLLKAGTPARERMFLGGARIYLLVTQLLTIAFAHQANLEAWLQSQQMQRISAALSEEIAQDLGAIKLHLESAAKLLPESIKTSSQSDINRALRLTSNALQATRRTILELGPAMIQEVGLVSACRLLGRQFSARTGIEVELIVEQSPEDIPADNQLALFRAMQVALNELSTQYWVRHVQVVFQKGQQTAYMEVKFHDGPPSASPRKPPQHDIRINTLRQTMHPLGGKIQIRLPRAESKPQAHSGQIEVRLPDTA